MDLVAIGKHISNIEAKHHNSISELNLLGFNVWKLYRNNICNRRYSNNYPGQKKKKQAVFRNLWSVAASFSYSKNKVIFRVTTAQYNQLKEGVWFSNKADVLRKSKGDNDFIFAQIGADRYKEFQNRELSPPIDLPSNFINFYARLLKYLFLPFVILPAIRHQKILLQVETFSFKTIMSLLMNFYANHTLYYLYYIFARPRKVLFLFASYGCEAEIAALKKLNIEVLEYQHGFLYKEHYGYNYHASIKSIKRRMLLPDKFYVYGEYWKNLLLEMAFFNSPEIVVAGHPDLEGVDNINIETFGKTPILVCSQPDLGPILQKFIMDYQNKSVFADSYHWIVRLHPREIPDGWEKFARRRSDVEISYLSTYSLMKFADIQLTGASTTLYEALYFRTSNYIILSGLNIDESDSFDENIGKVISTDYTGAFETYRSSEELTDKYFGYFNFDI